MLGLIASPTDCPELLESIGPNTQSPRAGLGLPVASIGSAALVRLLCLCLPRVSTVWLRLVLSHRASYSMDWHIELHCCNATHSAAACSLEVHPRDSVVARPWTDSNYVAKQIQYPVANGVTRIAQTSVCLALSSLAYLLGVDAADRPSGESAAYGRLSRRYTLRALACQ
jgi:hypothetical protein